MRLLAWCRPYHLLALLMLAVGLWCARHPAGNPDLLRYMEEMLRWDRRPQTLDEHRARAKGYPK